MRPLREVIIERLIQNKKLQQPSAEEMTAYITELEDSHDYDLLDEFEIMVTGEQ